MPDALHCTSSMPATNKVKHYRAWFLSINLPLDIVTVGDVNTTRPTVFAFRDRYKWCLSVSQSYIVVWSCVSYRDAWDKIKGMSKEQAMKEYVEKLILVRVAILHFCYPLRLPINSCWNKLEVQTLKPTSMRLKKLDKLQHLNMSSFSMPKFFDSAFDLDSCKVNA